jgi:large conductance mechanosensitive channel
MPIVADFKKFAFKGNVVDLAVGVIIGGAFGKIVSAIVADLVMPVVSLALPTGDWRKHGWVLREAADPKDKVVLQYGDFLGAVLDFAVISLVLFIVVAKIVKSAEARFDKPGEPATKECKFCLEVIPFKATRCKACTSELA